MKKRKSTLALVLAISLIISGIPQITFGLSNNKELNDPFEMMIDSTPELLSIKEIIDSSYKDSKMPIRIFEYQPTRNGDHPKEFLKGFNGYLITDAYQGYEKVE